MGACHYRDYDFMNLSGQLNIMCEYVGWHIGNSEVDFVVPIINRSWARADNFSKILQNSQTFARSAYWGQQSLSAQTSKLVSSRSFQVQLVNVNVCLLWTTLPGPKVVHIKQLWMYFAGWNLWRYLISWFCVSTLWLCLHVFCLLKIVNSLDLAVRFLIL